MLLGCAALAAPSTTAQETAAHGDSCTNQRDDDRDLLVDCEERDCEEVPLCRITPCEAAQCQLERCQSAPACHEQRCEDASDDDRDGLTDCHDPDCDYAAACRLDPAPEPHDCAGERVAGLPGGACFRLCQDETSCEPGSSCVGGLCLPGCERGCPEGFSCFPVEGAGQRCVADCTNDEQCPITGVCNPFTGRCEPDLGRRRDDEPCAADAECEGGLCLEQRCASVCDPNGDSCPAGESCHPTGEGLAGRCSPYPPEDLPPDPWTLQDLPPWVREEESRLSLGAFALSQPVSDEADPVFSLDRVHAVELHLLPGESARLVLGNQEWARASLWFDGQEIGEIGVRLKGSLGSGDPIEGKPGLSLKFNAHASGLHLYGLEKLALNNAKQDPSFLCEPLAYWLYARQGLPAPRAAYAELRLDGALYGLYVMVEAKDGHFLRTLIGKGTRWLYEGSYGADLDQPARLEAHMPGGEASLDAIRAALEGADIAALSQLVDLDALLAGWAIETLFHHWDGYVFQANNYYLAASPARPRWLLLPHGADQLFHELGPRLDTYPMGQLAVAWAPYGAADALRHELRRLLADPALEAELRDRVDGLTALIQEAALRDPRRPFTETERRTFTLWIRGYLGARRLTWSALEILSRR